MESNLHITETERQTLIKVFFFNSDLDALVLTYTKLKCGALILLSKPFTVVIQPSSTRLIKPNFCFHLSHRRSTTVSLEIHFQNYTFA